MSETFRVWTLLAEIQYINILLYTVPAVEVYTVDHIIIDISFFSGCKKLFDFYRTRQCKTYSSTGSLDALGNYWNIYFHVHRYFLTRYYDHTTQ